MNPLVEAAKPSPGVIGLGPTLPGSTNYLRGEADVAQGGGAAYERAELAKKQLEKNKKRLGFTWAKTDEAT